MNRAIEPEWLDELDAEDPLAAGSRRDLRRLNRLMRHSRILGTVLTVAFGSRPPRRIVELGAGDGWMMLGLARALSRNAGWRNIDVLLVDRQDVVGAETAAEFAAIGWRVETIRADVFDWMKKRGEPMDAILANLFLHHFSNETLSGLFHGAAPRTTLFAACETRRAGMALFLSRFSRLLGCNAVTRHDAVASVRAGFSGNELSRLWPSVPGWRLEEKRRGIFSHLFIARRKGDS